MKSNFWRVVSAKRNFIFILLCLAVHLFYLVLFLIFQIYPLVFINIFSSLFYVLMLLFYKGETDGQVVLAYLEIIFFSLLSDLFVGSCFDYLLFVIEMISVIPFLLAERYKYRTYLQIFGAMIAIFLYYCSITGITLFPNATEKASLIEIQVIFLNLIITISTVIYISLLYSIDIKEANDKLKYTSNHDTLTDLYNRRFFEQTLQRSISENSNHFSIAMFDIDDFKKINDNYGHFVGDNVLEAISRCLKNHVAGDELPIRWGGEEFMIYMPQKDMAQAYEIIEKICNDINKLEFNYKDKVIKVSSTVGIAYGEDLSAYEDVIKLADKRLYIGKNSGKNRIICKG